MPLAHPTNITSLRAEILGLFRSGRDSLDLAILYGCNEAQILGLLAAARAEERAAAPAPQFGRAAEG